jgi:H(+)-transporting ATP synthase subunit D
VPTVTTLGVVKARLAGANRGHALLKKKSDALTVQFRAILKRIVSAKEAMGDTMRAASLSLAEALYVAGAPLRHVVQQSVGRPARLRVRAQQDNIASSRASSTSWPPAAPPPRRRRSRGSPLAGRRWRRAARRTPARWRGWRRCRRRS